jgi:site-specific DNA recombinase
MKTKHSKAYAYARVSSESQAEKGTSIPSQLELMRRYAAQNSITILKEFVDEAESATTDNRPEFQDMIRQCRDNAQGVDCVLVWKLSRFARNRIDSVVYKKLLSKQGIRVISVSEPIEDSPEGRILEGMIELIDSYYSEILSKESLRGLKQTAQQGYHTGGKPPYGYQLKSVMVGSALKKAWEIEPKEAEGVKLIYRMHFDGHSYDEIIAELKRRGLKPRNKDEWGRSSISEVLRKPCYSGTHYFNTRKRKELGKRVHLRDQKDRSEWIEMKVPRLVEDDVFDSVKAKMGLRRFTAPRKTTNQILTGFLACGKCGQAYVIGDYYRGRYPYYRCSTKMKGGVKSCDNRNLRGDEIDSVVLKEVLELVFSRHNLEKYSEMIADSVTDEKKELEALVSRYAKEKEALNKKKAVYFEGLESGKLDTALVGERLRQLKDEEEAVSIKYLEADERLSSLAMPEQRRLTVKDYEELKQSLKSFVEESTAAQKKAFLSRFIKSVTVHPDKLTVEYHPPYFTNKKSPNHEGEGFSVIGVASPRGFEPLLPT